jgi:hypothetical protein
MPRAKKKTRPLSLGSISCQNVACEEAVYVIYFRQNLASGWPRVTNTPDINFDDLQDMVVKYETTTKPTCNPGLRQVR